MYVWLCVQNIAYANMAMDHVIFTKTYLGHVYVKRLRNTALSLIKQSDVYVFSKII